MIDTTLERAWELKQAFVDFVLDAEGDLAQALEAYVAEQLKQRSLPQDWVVDMFLIDGKVGNTTPIDLFLADQADLSEGDRTLIQNWRRTFTGLFAIQQVLPDGFELMNWLTAKRYIVKPSGSQFTPDMMARFQPGEVIITRISPVTDETWMFSTSYYTLMGKLGKPKLAVAIGNFKDNHKPYLYADAPELLEEAWRSVERYHQSFLDFFGGDEVTLPGYQLNQKIADFRDFLTKQQLAQMGIDESKSLEELAAEAGLDEAELAVAAEEMGLDAKEVAQAFDSKGSQDGSQNGSQNGRKNSPKMALPQVQLPDVFKKAEQVTAMTHPRWGQIFLPTYSKFKTLLEAEDWQTVSGAEALVRHFLDNPEINWFVWHRLAEQYPESLETVLRGVLNRPDFQLATDLDPLLQESGKPLQPELPEIASVPIHLHNLFEEAVQEVHKSSKPKGKEKKKTGFGAR
ncbi:MAG TPA: hypothetical protein V6C78_02815 [Crinalium sp.]|jgi:hypothetical protein